VAHRSHQPVAVAVAVAVAVVAAHQPFWTMVVVDFC
jgi:hypothetical protein